MNWSQVRKPVFWPPFILLTGSLIFSVLHKDAFLESITTANDWILQNFSGLFNIGTLMMVLTCLMVLFSPLGKTKIGGKDAQPLLNYWQLFSIILCTTVAVGILFWGTAEPLYHLAYPPESLGLTEKSAAAANFAMSTMYLHWSFTPYAIYTVPALMFALAYYNKKRAFSLSSALFPFAKKDKKIVSNIVDAICLFALVAGMAASLGAGILSLAGGIQNFTTLSTTPVLLGIIGVVIVISFIISAISGLLKGIRLLSTINMIFFIVLVSYLLLFGPLASIATFFIEGIQLYITQFFQKSLLSITNPEESWAKSWTVFYWANWLAWAPITALFLGKIAYGYTVRQFMFFNWIIPSVFSILYMSVFGGTTLHLELFEHTELLASLTENGPESIVYQLLDVYPYSTAIIFLFLITVFLSYVTAADSNTEAMASISSSGISPESPNPPIFLKIMWGITVGLVAWVMVSFSGIDGIKMLSNLGGLPSLFLIIAITVGLLLILLKLGKYLDKS